MRGRVDYLPPVTRWLLLPAAIVVGLSALAPVAGLLISVPADGLLLPGPVSLHGQSAPRPMTIDDWLRMVVVSDPQITSDGEQVLYAQRITSWEDNTVETTWWIVPAAGGTARRFLGPDAREVRLSPDGRFVSFLREEDGKAQVHLMRLDGGEAHPLTSHPTAVQSHEWSGDGRFVVFSAPEERDEGAWDPERGDDAVIVDEGPNTRVLGQWRNLWRIAVDGGEAERVTDVQLHLYEFEVSPTGDRVAFVARESSDRNHTDQNEIYVASVEGGHVEQLTEDRAVQDRLRWSPSGDRLAFTADDESTWTAKRDRLFVLDLGTGEPEAVSEAFAEGRIHQYWFAPDGERLVFSALQRTDTNLFEVDLASGMVRKRTSAVGTLAVASFAGNVDRIAFTFDDNDTPADVYVADLTSEDPVDLGSAVQLSHANPWVTTDLALASMDVIRWTSSDGLEIEGLLHHPIGEVEDPLPLMVHIHGGPAGFFYNAFFPAYHIYAGLGYLSLSPNVRGSDGYTDALREGNTHYRSDGIGYGDHQDLMTGVDRLIADGLADPDRLAVRGWSYGAILGAYTLTKTDRFKAAALGAGVYDWSAEYGMGYHWDVTRWYIGGTPWTNRDRWLDQSTMTGVDQITTPLLLLHGMDDNTTTEPQSAILFQAVKDIGKAPVRWIRFPREPHGFREPRHNRTRYVEEFRWVERYVRGVEWTPWEPPEE